MQSIVVNSLVPTATTTPTKASEIETVQKVLGVREARRYEAATAAGKPTLAVSPITLERRATAIVDKRREIINVEAAAREAVRTDIHKRKLAVNEAATHFDTSFLHLRYCDWDWAAFAVTGETNESEDWLGYFDNRNEYDTLEEYLAASLVTSRERAEVEFLAVSKTGGVTISYQLSVGEKNRLLLTFSMAQCRKDEAFDRLIGKEYAIARWAQDKVLEVPISSWPLNGQRWTSLVDEYRQTFPELFPVEPNHAKNVVIKQEGE